MSNNKKIIISYTIHAQSIGSKVPTFRKNGKWSCPHHYPAVEYHRDEERCQYIHCTSGRPDPDTGRDSLASEVVTLTYSDDTREIFQCLQGTGADLAEALIAKGAK
tara:strand:+ start:164 stop:481 length:318 start_codon:yes stop_codon:yes gene_type:complete